MKVVKSLDDLRRMALATGAEVLTPAGRFNSQRAQVAVLKAKDAPAPRPAAPAPVALSGSERSGSERSGSERSPPAAAAVSPVVVALAAPAVAEMSGPRQWNFAITYDADGAITNVTARSQP